MEKRPSKDEYFLAIARVVATRSTCIRRNVGCVLIDDHDNILSTGYNGVARGLPHCLDNPCEGAADVSGSGLEKCEAIHAEQNAFLQCRNVHEIRTCYVTVSPCLHCAKMLLNTGCLRIVYTEPYAAHFNKFCYLWETMGGRKLDRRDTWPIVLGQQVIELIDSVVKGL